MKKLAKVSTAVATAVSTMLLRAQTAFASSYSYTDTTAAEEGLLAGMGIAMWIGICCGAIIGLAALGFTVWMIMDVLKRDESVLPKKNMWLILMIALTFFTGLGFWVAVYYYFARKKKLDQMEK